MELTVKTVDVSGPDIDDSSLEKTLSRLENGLPYPIMVTRLGKGWKVVEWNDDSIALLSGAKFLDWEYIIVNVR